MSSPVSPRLQLTPQEFEDADRDLEHVENKQGYYLWSVTNEFVGKHAVYGFSTLYQDGKTEQYSMPFHIV